MAESEAQRIVKELKKLTEEANKQHQEAQAEAERRNARVVEDE